MPLFIKNSYFFVSPDKKRYEIATNFSNYIELGVKDSTPYYLEARIDNDEFKISGTLLGPDGKKLCQLKDNFIETSTGCTKEMTVYGYRIRDAQGNIIFEIRADGVVCHLIGTIYSDSGDKIAEGKDTTFILLRGPAIIGKSNSSIGIRIG